MRELRYSFWVCVLAAAVYVATFSPVVYGRQDGSTVFGVAVAVLALLRLYVLRNLERLTMEPIVIDRTPDDTFTDNRTLLEFEDAHPRSGGKKDEAIHRAFNVTPTRYYARLNQLLLTQEAREINGNLVNRLNRLAAEKTADRERRFAGRAS